MNALTLFRTMIRLALVVASLVLTPSFALADDLWQEVAKRAWTRHGKRQVYDFIRNQVKTKITQNIADLKRQAPPEYADALNTLGNTLITAQTLDELVDAIVEGRAPQFDKASEQYATAVAQHIAMIANKDKDRGAKLLGYLANKTSKAKEISQILGAASEGDLSKGGEWLGNAIIEYVCPPIAPWIKAAKAAYGAMAFVREVYVDRTMESLYQSYKMILETRGRDEAERWVHERFTVGGDEAFALRTRMAEIRKAREEAFSATGLKGDKIRQLVNEEALIRNIIATMNARHQREKADTVHKLEMKKAEQLAQKALEYLNDEMIRRHGRDWFTKIHLSDDDLAAYLAEVERLIREDGLDPTTACRLQALRRAYGLGHAKTTAFINEIARDLKTKNKALVLSTRGGAKIYFNRPPQGDKAVSAGSVLAQVSGSWKEKLNEADPPYRFGPYEVPCAGKLSAELEGTPAVPARWSLFNWNTSMTILFEPRLGNYYGPATSILLLRGQANDHKYSGQAEWPSAGRITVLCGAPRGGGPLTGGQFQQTFRGQVIINELRPESLLRAGQLIDSGDRLQLGKADEAVLNLRGTRLRATKNADLTLKLRSSTLGEVPYLEMTKGTVRLIRPSSPLTVPLELQLRLLKRSAADSQAKGTSPHYRLKPFGTDYEVTVNDDGTGTIQVFEGAVLVHDAADQAFWVDAGETLTLPQNVTSDSLSKPDLGCLVGGSIRIEDIPADTEPQPFGTIVGTFDNDRISPPWLWQDPGDDVTIRTPVPGTVELTVPIHNDFADNRDQGPRLLHKVTGDFDLSIDVESRCQGTHGASFDFVIFALGSYVGFSARQFEYDGHLAHYRKFGGWSLQHGTNKLSVYLRKDPKEWADAPPSSIKYRLQRIQDEFLAFWSVDGITWTLFQREVLAVPDTIWAGASFTRVAADRQPKEAATYVIRNLQLTSMERGKLKPPAWYFVQSEGKATADNQRVRLELAGTKTGEARAISSQPQPEDFDFAVRYRYDGRERGEGDSIWIQLAAFTSTGKDAVSVEWLETPRTPRRYSSRVIIEDSLKWYQHAPTTDTHGGLRVTRRKGVWQTYYWKEDQWSPFEKPWTGQLEGPVFLHLAISNKYDSKQPFGFSVDFRNANENGTKIATDTATSQGELKELTRVNRLPDLAGDFSYTAYEDRIVITTRENKSAVIGVAGAGKAIGSSFRQFLATEPAVATLLGEAVSFEMSILGNSLAVQVFEGGALVKERASDRIWWNAHAKRQRGLRPADELTRYPKVRFGETVYEISVRETNVGVTAADKREMRIEVGAPGKVIPPEFGRIIQEKGLNVGLGQAVTNAEKLFETGAFIQVYEGGVVLLDPNNNQFWWCRHAKRRGDKVTTEIALPKDPNAIVIQLDYVGGYTPPRKTKDPFLRIRADGRVTLISPFGQHPPIEAKISQEKILNFVKFAVEEHRFFSLNSQELQRAIQREAKKQQAPTVADLPTTVVTLRLADRVHEVRCESPEFYAEHLKGIQDLVDFQAVCRRLEKYMELLRGP